MLASPEAHPRLAAHQRRGEDAPDAREGVGAVGCRRGEAVRVRPEDGEERLDNALHGLAAQHRPLEKLRGGASGCRSVGAEGAHHRRELAQRLDDPDPVEVERHRLVAQAIGATERRDAVRACLGGPPGREPGNLLEQAVRERVEIRDGRTDTGRRLEPTRRGPGEGPGPREGWSVTEEEEVEREPALILGLRGRFEKPHDLIRPHVRRKSATTRRLQRAQEQSGQRVIPPRLVAPVVPHGSSRRDLHGLGRNGVWRRADELEPAAERRPVDRGAVIDRVHEPVPRDRRSFIPLERGFRGRWKGGLGRRFRDVGDECLTHGGLGRGERCRRHGSPCATHPQRRQILRIGQGTRDGLRLEALGEARVTEGGAQRRGVVGYQFHFQELDGRGRAAQLTGVARAGVEQGFGPHQELLVALPEERSVVRGDPTERLRRPPVLTQPRVRLHRRRGGGFVHRVRLVGREGFRDLALGIPVFGAGELQIAASSGSIHRRIEHGRLPLAMPGQRPPVDPDGEVARQFTQLDRAVTIAGAGRVGGAPQPRREESREDTRAIAEVGLGGLTDRGREQHPRAPQIGRLDGRLHRRCERSIDEAQRPLQTPLAGVEDHDQRHLLRDRLSGRPQQAVHRDASAVADARLRLGKARWDEAGTTLRVDAAEHRQVEHHHVLVGTARLGARQVRFQHLEGLVRCGGRELRADIVERDRARAKQAAVGSRDPRQERRILEGEPDRHERRLVDLREERHDRHVALQREQQPDEQQDEGEHDARDDQSPQEAQRVRARLHGLRRDAPRFAFGTPGRAAAGGGLTAARLAPGGRLVGR